MKVNSLNGNATIKKKNSHFSMKGFCALKLFFPAVLKHMFSKLQLKLFHRHRSHVINSRMPLLKMTKKPTGSSVRMIVCSCFFSGSTRDLTASHSS